MMGALANLCQRDYRQKRACRSVKSQFTGGGKCGVQTKITVSCLPARAKWSAHYTCCEPREKHRVGARTETGMKRRRTFNPTASINIWKEAQTDGERTAGCQDRLCALENRWWWPQFLVGLHKCFGSFQAEGSADGWSPDHGRLI